MLTGVLARAEVTANRPSPRLLSTLIEPTGRGAPRLRIHVGYAPASNSAAEDPFTPWLDTLQRTIATAQSSAPWIPDFVLADFNARLGSADNTPPHLPSSHGGYGFGSRNHRGEQVLSTAASLQLWVTNTGFDVPSDARVTHVSTLPSADGPQESQIDFILCPLHWASRCTSARSHREYILHSDHFPVVADFKWRSPHRRAGPRQAPRLDWQRIRQLPDMAKDDLRQNFHHRLDLVLADLANGTLESPAAMDTYWIQASAGLKAVAIATLPQRTPRRPGSARRNGRSRPFARGSRETPLCRKPATRPAADRWTPCRRS